MNPTPAPTTWHESIHAYLAWLRSAGRPESTVALRAHQLRRFAELVEPGPWDVGPDHLIEYLGSDPSWSPNYRRSLRSALRGFYGWGELRGWIRRSPALALPSIAVPRGRPRPLPPQVLDDALGRADARTRLMLVLGYRVGLRAIEISRVHVDHLERDLVGWSLRVIGKGGHVRVVPVNAEVADDIRHWIATYGIRDFLFEGDVDGHVSAGWVSKLLSRVIVDGTGHQLRHTYGTRALRAAGGNLLVPRDLLGHKSVATTEIYTLLDDDELREVANLL